MKNVHLHAVKVWREEFFHGYLSTGESTTVSCLCTPLYIYTYIYIHIHKMTNYPEKSANVHGPAYFSSNLIITLNAKSVILMNS